jgi:hypothetical protein
MPRLLSVLAACLSLMSLSGLARAAEYCVSCAGPDAAYRCKIEGTPDGPGDDPRAQLLCIRQLAESGAHESCSVARSASYPCPGELKVIAGPVGEVVPPASAEPAGEWAPVPSPPAPPPADGNVQAQPAPGTPPKTVEELAGQTVNSSKDGLKKAGETISGTAEKAGEQIGSAGSAVGNAAKKTWNCLTSLFSDC